MKFVGRINLTKQELLDIIFKRETIQIDQQVVDKFEKKKNPIISVECLIQQILENFSKDQQYTEGQKLLNQDAQFQKAFLMIILLQILGKKGDFRVEVAQFLVNLLNSDQFLENNEFATNPYSVFQIFYSEEQNSFKEAIEKVENFDGFPKLSERELQYLIKKMEKIYVFAFALRQISTLQSYLSLSILSYAFYCESQQINTDFLKAFENKSTFARNISIASSIIQNLLSNSTLQKQKASADDTTFVELCGQSRYNLNQMLNFIVEELSVEDLEGVKIKGGLDRTNQTLNSLSLQAAGAITVQVENGMNRMQEVLRNLDNEEAKANIQKVVQGIVQLNEQNYQRLSFQKQGPGLQSVPYILSLQNFVNTLQYSSEIEVFTALSYLFKKNGVPEPELPQEEVKDKKAKKQKKKKSGLGVGTQQIYNLFCQYQVFGSQEEEVLQTPQNLEKLVQTFFNQKNSSLLSLFEELTVSKNSERRKVKIAKGTQDFGGREMAIRRKIFNTVTEVFRAHGAVQIETPVFELKETLTGKYGEDSKLIYDLEYQGGELLSLRYDLTVPFARFMAQQNKTNIKRYQIQKVYRRDQPNIKRGRYREFYQCDFDISGNSDAMLQDSEIISVFDTILTKLNFKNYNIKVNNRKILDAMIEISGAPVSKFKAICSAVDKLDKEPWEAVKKELIEDKGIDPVAVDKLGKFVSGEITGSFEDQSPMEILNKLVDTKVFAGSQKGEKTLEEMRILFTYLEKLNALGNVTFDLSLARGLDYYTGMIFEIVLKGEQVGSIAGGGRYDELIGMFMEKKDAAPSVGGSLGIERIYKIIETRNEMKKFTETEAFVVAIQGFAQEKLEIASECWNADIKVEYSYKVKDKPQKQLDYCNNNNIPFAIVIGESEVQENKVAIKKLYQQNCPPEEKQITVSRENYIQVLKEKINQYYIDVENGQVDYSEQLI